MQEINYPLVGAKNLSPYGSSAKTGSFIFGNSLRSVLGIENAKGSPFNVQRSLHIPNLTFEEVEGMFRWHEAESDQRVDQEVIERLYYETKGQPGLICWFGELLTEGWEKFCVRPDMPMDMKLFRAAYAAATQILPNNKGLNSI